MTQTEVPDSEAKLGALGDSPSLVIVKGLTKALGPTQAVRDASYELLKGEVHALFFGEPDVLEVVP